MRFRYSFFLVVFTFWFMLSTCCNDKSFVFIFTLCVVFLDMYDDNDDH